MSGTYIVGPVHSILVGTDLDHGASEQWPSNRVPYDFGVNSNSAEKSWATLRIVGGTSHRPARTERSRMVPLWGGGTIKGEVIFDINPKNQQTIREISLLLRGSIRNGSGSYQYFTFCEDKHPVWPGPNSGPTPKGSNKFIGSHSFPFEFPFPTHVDLTNRCLVAPRPQNLDDQHAAISRGLPSSPSTTSLLSRVFRRSSLMLSGSVPGAQGNPTHLDPAITTLEVDGKRQKAVWPLPHSASPSTGVVQVVYELVLQVSHGRLRPQTKIKVPIHMVPRLIPPQAATIGDGLPTKNPAGWLDLPPFDVTGWLAGIGFGSTHFTMTYKLFISKPLSYIRGCSIRLFLAVKVSSGNRSSPFCSPGSINVRLRQRLDYLGDRNSSVGQYDDVGDKDIHQKDSTTMDLSLGIPGESQSLGTSVQHRDLGSDSGRGLFIHSVEDAAIAIAKWEDIPPKELEGDTSHLEQYQSFLVGKVDLPKDLEPSSACPIYRRQYFIDFDAPTVPSFTPFTATDDNHPVSGSGKSDKTKSVPYVSQAVDIASLPHFL